MSHPLDYASHGKTWVRTNETTWRRPDREHEAGESIEWYLRYGKPTREQLLQAASFIACYNALVYSTARKRQRVIRAIRMADAIDATKGDG